VVLPTVINFNSFSVPSNWNIGSWTFTSYGFQNSGGLYSGTISQGSSTTTSFTNNFANQATLSFRYYIDDDFSLSGNKFEVIIDNGSPINIPTSGSSWSWFTSSNIQIPAGQHIIKFQMSRGFNSYSPEITLDDISW
jgi:hypothetical protein